jgi:threonine dehydrogenase-like Zn-dependent dehydrogenase
MKAIALTPGKPGLALSDFPEPAIEAADQVKLRVLRVGICGTDREEEAGGRALAPNGRDRLIIGHEMLGRVVETGGSVTRVKRGDFAVCTVRRGCGGCLPCGMDRPDMCLTGRYLERGIWGLDGYQAETVVESERYLIRVPAELADVGVLTEPLSVAEKAIDEAQRVQTSRLPESAARPYWLYGRRCLVAGLGPIGLLAAMCLRLRGADVYGLDVVDRESNRPRWLARIGGTYVDARKVSPSKVEEHLGGMELIFEATGVASLEFNLLDALATNGIYILTGIPGGDRPLELQGAELVRRLVLGNQLMAGSVNASRDHYQMAVDDLGAARRRWEGLVGELLTTRVAAREFQKAFSSHDQNEIKATIEWAGEKGESHV